MVYEPAEDSELLKKNIKDYAKGIVLDMGSGSGILAKEAALYAKEVYAADIDQNTIEYLQKHLSGIKIVKSDLFSYFMGKNIKFDTIIFNPPYLPQDKGIDDPALYGGKHGYEVIDRFFSQVNEFMKEDTNILLLFSTFTKKEKVEEIISKRCFSYKEIDRENLFFERLFVYLVEKSYLLKELENKGLTKVNYFARGKRGIVYKGEYKGKKIIIKAKNPDSEAIGRIEHEAEMLKKLNKYGIGPKFLFAGNNYLVYEFIEGVMFPEFIRENEKKEILNVLDEIFNQLKKLDELGINKEEMHKPNKHILVGKTVTMIDYERARFTEKSHNITQFIIYLASGNIMPILKDKGFCLKKDKLIEIAKSYRQGNISAEEIKKYVKNGIQ